MVQVARLLDSLGPAHSLDNAREATVALCRLRVEREEVDRELARYGVQAVDRTRHRGRDRRA